MSAPESINNLITAKIPIKSIFEVLANHLSPQGAAACLKQSLGERTPRTRPWTGHQSISGPTNVQTENCCQNTKTLIKSLNLFYKTFYISASEKRNFINLHIILA